MLGSSRGQSTADLPLLRQTSVCTPMFPSSRQLIKPNDYASERSLNRHFRTHKRTTFSSDVPMTLMRKTYEWRISARDFCITSATRIVAGERASVTCFKVCHAFDDVSTGTWGLSIQPHDDCRHPHSFVNLPSSCPLPLSRCIASAAALAYFTAIAVAHIRYRARGGDICGGAADAIHSTLHHPHSTANLSFLIESSFLHL